MVDGLDVVAVGVEHVGGVVAGMVRPLAGNAVVAAAGGQRGIVETLYGIVVGAWNARCMFLVGAPSALTKSSSDANQPSPPRISRPSELSAAS